MPVQEDRETLTNKRTWERTDFWKHECLHRVTDSYLCLIIALVSKNFLTHLRLTRTVTP